ncbi:ATP-grasp fold amidoligase family protein [Peribacillus simplex]|uniref:ATP-grasp fold amidoligase family protein n=1 Tax=Peribacillus simplex TaxID=1478 RepID=UPI002E23FB12|nr:ATP-grasp fold amidoligase family protein [Peribacillus simplex]MED4094032.1 ATP-grasp fold amidoligase family protein [Peribacillus simplex]
MLKKIIKVVKQPNLLVHFLIKNLKIFRLISDESYLKINYKLRTRKKLNLENPKTFNEKLQWLKVYNQKPEYTKMVDKYEMRDYVAQTIGEKYLIPLLGVYNSYDEIDFDVLPEQFVLKPNHTSGDVYICQDKTKIDHPKLKKEINKWLNREYYWIHREWPYKNVKPRIICEKFLVDVSGTGLKDYKFMCFNKEVKCIFVCSNRASQDGVNIDIYDINWKLMPFVRKQHPNSGILTPPPKYYNEMLDIAHELSKVAPFIRVDFYETNGMLFIGELTFYPGSGYEEFNPQIYDEVLGNWLDIQKI